MMIKFKKAPNEYVLFGFWIFFQTISDLLEYSKQSINGRV